MNIRAIVQPTGSAVFETRSILIADPAIESGSAIVERLVEMGFDVLLASTLRAANAFANSRTLAFALLDLQFEDGDCFPLIEEIRRANPEARILVHSAFCNVAVAVRATKAGASDVLPKPVETDFVLALLLGDDARRDLTLKQLPTPNAVMREHIKTVYVACDGNVTRTARELSMHRRTLQRMLARTQPLMQQAMSAQHPI